MKSFNFVDFEKIRKIQKKLSLYGVYGLRNDIMLENEIEMNQSNKTQNNIE